MISIIYRSEFTRWHKDMHRCIRYLSGFWPMYSELAIVQPCTYALNTIENSEYIYCSLFRRTMTLMTNGIIMQSTTMRTFMNHSCKGLAFHCSCIRVSTFTYRHWSTLVPSLAALWNVLNDKKIYSSAKSKTVFCIGLGPVTWQHTLVLYQVFKRSGATIINKLWFVSENKVLQQYFNI